MTEEWWAAACDLSDELRAVAELLAVSDLRDLDLVAATQLARSLRRRLEGPRRTRWYDDYDESGPISEAAGSAYRDQSPVRGRLNPVAPPLIVDEPADRNGRQVVCARATLGHAYEGPPHGVHGGWVAALFDDLLGQALGLLGVRGVTAKLSVRYRHLTPIGEELRLESWIHEDKGRRIIARASCYAGDTRTADAEGVFVRVDFGEVGQRMRARARGSATPDA